VSESRDTRIARADRLLRGGPPTREASGAIPTALPHDRQTHPTPIGVWQLGQTKGQYQPRSAYPVDGEGWAMFCSIRELSAISSSRLAVRLDFPLKAVLEPIGLNVQVVVHLQAKPELR